MTVYDEAKSAIDAVSAASGAVDALIAAHLELQDLAADQIQVDAAIQDLQAQLVAITPATLKPVPAGLWTRDSPVIDRSYDAAYPGFIGRVNWRDLEPLRGQFSSGPIDAIRTIAKARGKQTAIRFYSGDQAPLWAKSLGGPIRVYNPTDRVWGSVGAWWDGSYQAAFEEALVYIASQVENDPLFLMVCNSLGGMIYPEPFLRSLGDPTTHANLAAAGLTTAKDHAALRWAVQAYSRHFHNTRTFLSYNPGQDFDKRTQDLSWSDEMTNYLRTALGDRAVFYSTSLDAQPTKAAADQHVYNQFVTVGGPRAIQTEQNSRISSWSGMMQYGVSLGFSMVETSAGGWEKMQSPAQALNYSKMLAANIA